MTNKENTYEVKKWDWLRKSIFILLLLCSVSSELNGQTTLLSPTGDGGFETGPTFAGNNWTAVNAASNFWEVGAVASAYAGTRGAYIVNAAGTYSYTTTTSRTSHLYGDIAIPTCASNTTLSFYWKGKGESGWDRLLVYTAPTTVTPVANVPASSSTTLTGATLVWTQPSLTTTYTLATVSIPQALSGTTVRIIFTWQNDASGGTTPSAAVDNISLVYYSTPSVTSPTSASITMNSATLGGNITSIGCSNVTERGIFWSTTNGFADGAGTKVSELPGPYTTGTFTEAVTGLSPSTMYYYKAFATNSYGTIYSTQGSFFTKPSNDNCATAISINPENTCGILSQVSGSIEGATNSGTAGCSGGNADDDIWYTFIAEATSQYLTLGNSSGTDFVTQVFSGSCASLTSIGCYDTDPNNQQISGLTIGATYFVRVFSYFSSAITGVNALFTLCIQNPPTVAEDLCSSAILVPVGTTCELVNYSNIGATETAGETAPGCGGAVYKDVWFKFVVPTSGRVLITTDEVTFYNCAIAIYSGSCGSLSLIECNYVVNSMPVINHVGLTPGSTIYLRFWHKDGLSTGTFGLCIKEDTAPPSFVANAAASNVCNSAPLINNLTGYYGNLSGATADSPGDLWMEFCGTVENNVWLKFIADGISLSLTATISSCSAKSGVQMQIYQTSDCLNFTSVSNCFFPAAMQDGTLTANGLTAGQTYYLMIDGNGGDICNYALGATFGVVLGMEIENFETECIDGKVNLRWDTKTETNNDFFTIQRSTDVKSWIEIAQINGAGNSSIQNSYSFVDHNADNETIYYRLKQTNFDGKISYSEIISTRSCKSTNDDIAIYPNPFTNDLFIDISKIHSPPLDIQIEDVLGKIVYNSSDPVSKNGVIILSLDPLIQQGYYTIRIKYSDKIFEEHIIKN